eukprot:g4161.t1
MYSHSRKYFRILDAVKKVAYRPGTSVNLIASSSRLKRRAVRGWKEEVLQSHIARSFEETLALQLQQFHSSEWKPGDLSCNLTPRSDEPQSDSLTVSPEVPLDSQQQTDSSLGGSKQNERQEDHGHELCSPAVDNHEQMNQDEVVLPNCTDVENENAEDRQTLFDLSISGSDPFAGLRSPALATVKSEQQLDFCGAGTAAADGIPDLLMSPALVDRSDEFQFRNAASGGDDANIPAHNFDFRGRRCVEKTSLLLSPDEQEAGRAAGTEVFSAESGRDRAGPEAQQVASVDVVTVPLLFRQKVSERVLPATRHARHFTAPTAASKRRRSGGGAEGGGERGGVGCDPSVDDQGWSSRLPSQLLTWEKSAPR